MADYERELKVKVTFVSDTKKLVPPNYKKWEREAKDYKDEVRKIGVAFTEVKTKSKAAFGVQKTGFRDAIKLAKDYRKELQGIARDQDNIQPMGGNRGIGPGTPRRGRRGRGSGVRRKSGSRTSHAGINPMTIIPGMMNLVKWGKSALTASAVAGAAGGMAVGAGKQAVDTGIAYGLNKVMGTPGERDIREQLWQNFYQTDEYKTPYKFEDTKDLPEDSRTRRYADRFRESTLRAHTSYVAKPANKYLPQTVTRLGSALRGHGYENMNDILLDRQTREAAMLRGQESLLQNQSMFGSLHQRHLEQRISDRAAYRDTISDPRMRGFEAQGEGIRLLTEKNALEKDLTSSEGLDEERRLAIAKQLLTVIQARQNALQEEKQAAGEVAQKELERLENKGKAQSALINYSMLNREDQRAYNKIVAKDKAGEELSYAERRKMRQVGGAVGARIVNQDILDSATAEDRANTIAGLEASGQSDVATSLGTSTQSVSDEIKELVESQKELHKTFRSALGQMKKEATITNEEVMKLETAQATDASYQGG